MSKRELSPKTIIAYDYVLRQAGVDVRGPAKHNDVSGWTESRLIMLRAALLHVANFEGRADFMALAEALPRRFVTKKIKRLPKEHEIELFKEGVAKLPNAARCGVLLLLQMGFRVDEFLMLPRGAVESALDTGDLVFTRKGGDEATLPVAHVRKEWKALLACKARPAYSASSFGEKWSVVHQIYSPSGVRASYVLLLRGIDSLGRDTGSKVKWTPHLLRHIFATKMMRDGAPVPVIQRALGHKHYNTTVRTYVHVETTDLAKWMK